MYAAKQVKKFLYENVADEGVKEVIQRRADVASSKSDGLFLHRQLTEIFENPTLAETFARLAISNYDYKKILSRVMESRNRRY